MSDLADVARHAGVSTSTASRAPYRPEMAGRQVVTRVREAAKALGYARNPFARSPRAGVSKTLAPLVPDNTKPCFAEVAKGIEADRSLEKEFARARLLYEQRVDGVLLFKASDASAATIAWLLAHSMPAVLLERRSPALPSLARSAIMRTGWGWLSATRPASATGALPASSAR